MSKLFVPTPNVVEVSWETFAADSINTTNVCHFLNNNPPTTQLQIDHFVGALSTWYAVNVMPFLSHEWTYDTCKMLPIDVDGLDFTVDHAHIVGGGYPQPALPNNCALRLELRTGVPGRAYRGCKYIGGVPDNVITGNRFDPGWIIFIEVAWSSLIPIATGNGWTWVLLSKIEGGIPRAEGLVTPITEVFAQNNVVDSMKRRVHQTV